MSYRDYFDFDSEVFCPVVDKHVIEQNPGLWKKFYPHESFIKLLSVTVDVLKKKKNKSIWVEGAYGTGKSHAVLTLKKLIEASREDTIAYFDKYPEVFDEYLTRNELLSSKADGKIIVCHRYSASSIYDDNDLVLAIQESIEEALQENGIENQASTSVRDSLIKFFENEENARMFNIKAQGSARQILGGDMAQDVLRKLRDYSGDSLAELIKRLFMVDFIKGAFRMSTTELGEWIKEVITKNNIKQIFFIWDEFSEFFENNMKHFTGFQEIAELAASIPFCLLIVTHIAQAYFSAYDKDTKKILDRFIDLIKIELPENIAFTLMGQAMKITDNPTLANRWNTYKSSLIEKTVQSRTKVAQTVNIKEEDFNKVLPIHPFAALLLERISQSFTSNARSMFTFIKSDDDENTKAFQWFIDRFDFTSENPFITVDMLWSFFYDSGKDKLVSGFRKILDCYKPNGLDDDQIQVYKTIILLQAVSDRIANAKEIFKPNDKNIALCFEGTQLESAAVKIAKNLLANHIISRTPLTGDNFTYCCISQAEIDYRPFEPKVSAWTTEDLSLKCTDLREYVELKQALNLRYDITYSSITKLDNDLNKADNRSAGNSKIYAVTTIAKDNVETSAVQNKIRKFFVDHPQSNVVVIDASDTIIELKKYEEMVENYATALAIGGSDRAQQMQYENLGCDILRNWAKAISQGSFYVYSRYNPNGDRAANDAQLQIKLSEINKFRYHSCLENHFTNVIDTMYVATSLKLGALCGIQQEMKGTFKSANPTTKLENALVGAWQTPDYWVNGSGYIVKLKIAVDALINNKLSKTDRISIRDIWDMLKDEPYGFMPCNLSAFTLGFLLKEYANNVYSYSDGKVTQPLSADYLADMIADIIKLDNTPNFKYTDKYIVALTPQEKEFNRVTSFVFGIDEKYCIALTDTASHIRKAMKNFDFPIWVTEYVIGNMTISTSSNLVTRLIQDFCSIANDKNDQDGRTANDIAQDIGKTCLDNPSVVDDLKKVLTHDNCRDGMRQFLKTYREGVLPALGNDLGDGAQYLNQLKNKFSSDAANWVWNRDTVYEKIDEVIVEYEIILNSNKILPKQTAFNDTIREWNSKLDTLRLSFKAVENHLGEEKDFLSMLYSLKKQGRLLDSQKATFLDLLRKYPDAVNDFESKQVSIFVEAFKYYLGDLDSTDAETILYDAKYQLKGTFTVDSNIYAEKVKSAINTYKACLKSVELRKLWLEKTGTPSPMNWSEKYSMPILAMVPENEFQKARRIFQIVNSKNPTNEQVDEAMDYISNMTYIDKLSSATERDMAFAKTFLGEYSALFDDINEVKNYLVEKVADKPYFWLGNTEITSMIKKLANDKYDKTGFQKANSIIDDMPTDMLKNYLKKLIRNNIVVGTQIIKNN